MSKPSKVPYPGQAKSMTGPDGLCYYCDLTEEQRSELYNLIKEGEPNVLQRAMISKADETSQYFTSYQDAELWCYNYWHKSPNDAEEHATFRLFDDVSSKPWNYRTYHLYKDGKSKSWAHEKSEAEERPT